MICQDSEPQVISGSEDSTVKYYLLYPYKIIIIIILKCLLYVNILSPFLSFNHKFFLLSRSSISTFIVKSTSSHLHPHTHSHTYLLSSLTLFPRLSTHTHLHLHTLIHLSTHIYPFISLSLSLCLCLSLTITPSHHHTITPSLHLSITPSHHHIPRLWDLGGGGCRSTLTHHTKSVRALAAHQTEYGWTEGDEGGDERK